jgi:hypothetical protein
MSKSVSVDLNIGEATAGLVAIRAEMQRVNVSIMHAPNAESKEAQTRYWDDLASVHAVLRNAVDDYDR